MSQSEAPMAAPGAVRSFGRMPDGTEILAIGLGAGPLALEVIGLGAAIRDLVVMTPAGPQRVVLGFPKLDDYRAHSPYFGVIAGRYANRIRGGRFLLDGQAVQLTRNENGRNHLHGGACSFSHRAWRVVEHGPAHVDLALTSPGGEEGYPGTVEARCRYLAGIDGTLSIALEATTDAPTIVNLAAHSYFNLDGSPDILDHRLTIAAEAFTPVDGELIPTGAIAPVEGTPFDFRAARPLRLERDGHRVAYDHNFVLAQTRRSEPRFAARLEGGNGVALEIHTTEPGLQLYDGSLLRPSVPGLDGVAYGPNAGLCLEPQLFPDTPNNPAFGSAVLRPGDVYRQTTVYRFDVGPNAGAP